MHKGDNYKKTSHLAEIKQVDNKSFPKEHVLITLNPTAEFTKDHLNKEIQKHLDLQAGLIAENLFLPSEGKAPTPKCR